MQKGNTYLNYILPVMASIFFLSKFFDFSSSGNPSYLIWGFLGILSILTIFREYKYFFEIYSLILISLIIFSGLILGYTYLFKSVYVQSLEYYVAVGFFIFFIVYFVYSYHRKSYLDPS